MAHTKIVNIAKKGLRSYHWWKKRVCNCANKAYMYTGVAPAASQA